MIPTKKKKPDHSLMSSWINANASTKITEHIGLAKWALTLNPQSQAHSNACNAMVRYMVRHNWKQAQPAIFEHLNNFAVQTVLHAWKKQKSPKAVPFCINHMKLLPAIFEENVLDAVMQAKDDNYNPVEAQVHQLIQSNDAGQEIWGFAGVKCLSQTISAEIRTQIAAWINSGQLTEDGKNKAICSIIEHVARIPNIELLPAVRTVMLNYVGKDFEVMVKSVPEEVKLAISFAWRPMAVKQGKLVPLWCEGLAVKTPVILSERAIDGSLVAQPQLARTNCNIVFREAGRITGILVSNLLKNQTHEFESIDPEFEADALVVLAVAGKDSECTVFALFLDRMPEERREKTPEEVLMALTSMENEDAYRLAHKPAQSQFGLVKKKNPLQASGPPGT